MRRHLHDETILLHDAWVGVPPQSTVSTMDGFSVPVKLYAGDPDRPRDVLARFDYLVGWVDPWSLQPLDKELDILGWSVLPEEVLEAVKPNRRET